MSQHQPPTLNLHAATKKQKLNDKKAGSTTTPTSGGRSVGGMLDSAKGKKFGSGRGGNNTTRIESSPVGKKTSITSATDATAATSHTGTTLRAVDKQRRTVFKAVLDSPFTITWPTISKPDLEIIFEALCRVLSCIGEYRLKKRTYRRSINKKKKQGSINKKDEEVRMEINSSHNNNDITTTNDYMDVDAINEKNKSSELVTVADTQLSSSIYEQKEANVSISSGFEEPPSIFYSLIFGINAVTKHLEQTMSSHVQLSPFYHRIQKKGKHVDTTTNDDNNKVNKLNLRLIFVAKNDISPDNLYAHLPTMASMQGRNLLLVTLPKGALRRLGQVTGMKSVSCIGVLANDAPELNTLYELVKSKVEPVTAFWLDPIRKKFARKRKFEEEDYQTINNKVTSSSVVKDRDDASIVSANNNNPYVLTKIKQLITAAPVRNQKKGKKKEKSKIV
ncbi:2980_t:CDS:2 [Ambispora leptoticha]|uniref:2980_t:CDS:1 n=1 Tax=Ambispora leptoticha TaxID=144679 RepID=A0A9N9ALK3_9GLOM|nr:2980_t:CDS:2 [Ambispora leptoticha]